MSVDRIGKNRRGLPERRAISARRNTMKYDEFMGQVQNGARLPTQGEAARAICATLETLGEMLNEDEAMHLAAQLPPGIGAYLRLARSMESFEVDEFFQRVAEREGVEVQDAAYHTRAVLAVLQDAVTPGQMDHVRAQLSEEFDALFEAGTEGQLDL
jgi:uncharacterized protein (DUF2267 family)